MPIDYRVMKYRPNVVSVVIGCIDFLKNLCSPFRLYMYCANCEKFCRKYRIMWRMPSNLFLVFSNSFF